MRRTYKRPFRRTHRKVTWLTSPKQRETTTLTPATVERIPLGGEDNDFIVNHPKFAKANDTIRYKRIVGRLRFSMYFVGPPPYPVDDALIEWGICLVKGDYDDAGVWTATADTLPNPAEPGDDDDKWLWKDSIVLAFPTDLTIGFAATSGTESLSIDANDGYVLAKGSAPVDGQFLRFQQQRIRPAILSSDEQLPNGSLLDISTRRKALYTEKLSIVASLAWAGDPTKAVFFCENRLRVLIGG